MKTVIIFSVWIGSGNYKHTPTECASLTFDSSSSRISKDFTDGTTYCAIVWSNCESKLVRVQSQASAAISITVSSRIPYKKKPVCLLRTLNECFL